MQLSEQLEMDPEPSHDSPVHPTYQSVVGLKVSCK